MKTRLITAGVAVVIALAIIILGSFYSIIITIALALVGALLCGEYLSAKKLHKDLKLFLPCLAFAMLIPALSATEARYIPLYVFAVGLCIMSVIFHKTAKTENIMFALVGVSVITVENAYRQLMEIGRAHV